MEGLRNQPFHYLLEGLLWVFLLSLPSGYVFCKRTDEINSRDKLLSYDIEYGNKDGEGNVHLLAVSSPLQNIEAL